MGSQSWPLFAYVLAVVFFGVLLGTVQAAINRGKQLASLARRARNKRGS